MIPITRIDEYLAVISQDEDATGLPDQAVTRIDTYLSKIAGEAVAELPEPVTRIDRYLANIAGMVVVMDDPITRIDYYLATVAGAYSGELPEPVTRIDHYLYNWAEGGDLPWQTFTGNPLQFNAPKAHTLRSTVVAFSPIQSGSGDPSPDNVRPISGWTGVDIYGAGDIFPVEGGGLLDSTGAETQTGARIRTGYIEASSLSSIELLGKSSDERLRGIHYYDSNKTWISAWTDSNGFDLPKTSNFHEPTQPYSYVRFVFQHNPSTLPESTTGKSVALNFSTIPITFRADTVNQWDEEWEVGLLNTSTGEPTQATGVRTKNFVPIQPSTVYYCKCPQKIYIIEYAQDQSYLRYYTWKQNQTYKSSSDAYYIKFYMVDIVEYGHDVSINYPATETGYHPYLTTVYGGYLRINRDGSVTLTALRASKDYDGSNDEGWTVTLLNTGVYRAQIYISSDMKHYGNVSSAHLIANIAKSSPLDEIGNIKQYSDRMWLYPPVSVTSEAELRAFLGSNNLQVCYELATPVTYHLPSVEALQAIKGINTMWTDGDSLTVEARGEAVNLNALQSLNMLLGGRYYNNGTADEPTDEEALDILLGGHER